MNLNKFGKYTFIVTCLLFLMGLDARVPDSYPEITILATVRAYDGFEQSTSPSDNFTNFGSADLLPSTANHLGGYRSLHLISTGIECQYKNSIQGPAIIEIFFYDSLTNAIAWYNFISSIGYGSLGLGSPYTFYMLITPSGLFNTSISRTLGWHNFTVSIDSNPTTKMYIDEILVDTQSTGSSITTISFDAGGFGTPTPDFFYDDFSIRDPGTLSPIITLTETVTSTFTENHTVSITKNNTITNTVTTNDTVTITGNQTETFTSYIPSISTLVSNTTHFDTKNVTTTFIRATTEYQTSDPSLGFEPPSFTVSTDFLLGIGSGMVVVFLIIILRRLYG